MVYSSRKAFELAKKAPGCVFSTRVDIDIEKIKQSKYFRALVQQPRGMSVNELVLIFQTLIFIWFVLTHFLDIYVFMLIKNSFHLRKIN